MDEKEIKKLSQTLYANLTGATLAMAEVVSVPLSGDERLLISKACRGYRQISMPYLNEMLLETQVENIEFVVL